MLQCFLFQNHELYVAGCASKWLPVYGIDGYLAMQSCHMLKSIIFEEENNK